MKTRMRYILAIWSVFSVSSLFAQPGGVIIDVNADRSVEKADRIPVTPRIVDTVIPTPIIEYPLLQLKHETDTEVSMITPASINTKETLTQLYNSYLKLGVGTEFMPLGEYYFDSKRSKKFIYGVHVKHLSSFGDISGYAPAQFDRTGVDLYGGINERRYSLRGDMHYKNQGLHYYGMPLTQDTLIADSIAQRYSDFGFGAGFSSHKKDSANLNYKVGFDYNNYTSRRPKEEALRDWRTNENNFGIKTSAWYKYGDEIFGADFNIRYNGYKYGIADSSLTLLDTGLVANNGIVNLHPTAIMRRFDDKFLFRFGADIVFNGENGKTKAHIYPDIEVKYSMFNDIFIPYAGLGGGMKQITFKSLTNENEFLIPNIELRNEGEINVYAGIKGTLSKRLGFNIGGKFGRITNKALFVTDTTFSAGNKFKPVYDTMNIAMVEGSMSYQLSNKIKIDGIARFNSYNVFTNSYAWNLPQLEFVLRGSYNLYDKFLFNLDVNMEHGRKALVYAPGAGITEENQQFIQDLGFIIDANVGVEYRYNKRISAFVQLNNFASQQYMRWHNAPVQRFQALGGVTFRF
jgi:hypothetical protein